MKLLFCNWTLEKITDYQYWRVLLHVSYCQCCGWNLIIWVTNLSFSITMTAQRSQEQWEYKVLHRFRADGNHNTDEHFLPFLFTIAVICWTASELYFIFKLWTCDRGHTKSSVGISAPQRVSRIRLRTTKRVLTPLLMRCRTSAVRTCCWATEQCQM